MDYRHMGGGTIGGLLRARAAVKPDSPLLITRDVTYSYREIDQLSDRAGRALMALGCRKGDAVSIMVRNRPEYLIAWFGIARAGLVQVPVNPDFKGEFLAYQMEHSESAVIFADTPMLPQLLSAGEAFARVNTLIFTSDAVPDGVGALGVPTVLGWSEFIAGGDGSDDFPEVAHWDVATIMYTSGTTGRSKGVVTPHLHNLMQGYEASQALRIGSRDVLYTCLPLFHGNAQWATVFNALQAGAAIALGERFSVSQFWDEVRALGATEFNAIGSMLYMLDSQAPTPKDQEHAVRTVFAAPVPPEIFYRFEQRFGLHLIEGYGLTETKNIAYNPYDARRPGSFGKPTPTSILTILGAHNEELPPGQLGEIAYRPKVPNIICRGYFKNPEATLGATSDLWWHTGDLGYRDEDGYFYFVDRAKDAIRRRGENIASFEVERVLLLHPAVLDVAAVAVASDVIEDEVMAVVVAKPGQTIEPAELFAFCDARMPYFAVPRFIRFVRELPRTPNDKVRKVELRAAGLTPDTWDSAAAGIKPSRAPR
jgi:crotonobetaine/carnitine-CoA ligase